MNNINFIFQNIILSVRRYDKKAPKPPRIHHGKGYYVPKGLPSTLSSQWLDGSFHDSKKSMTLANKAIVPIDSSATLNLKCTNIEKIELPEDNVKVFALHPKVKPLFPPATQNFTEHQEKETKASREAAEALLPPLTRARKPLTFPYRQLTADEISEMRSLRQRDPFQWSIRNLAAQFQCTASQVMAVAPCNPLAFTAKKAIQEEQLAQAPLKYKRRVLFRQKLAEHREEAFHQHNY